MKVHILIKPYVSFEGNHLSPVFSVRQFPDPVVSLHLVHSVDFVAVLLWFLFCRNLVVNYGASVNMAVFAYLVDDWLTQSLSWGSEI